MAKTLRDYLLNGGIRGRFFHIESSVPGRTGIYRVTGCAAENETRVVGCAVTTVHHPYIIAVKVGDHSPDEINLGGNLSAREATLKEVRTAMESKLNGAS